MHKFLNISMSAMTVSYGMLSDFNEVARKNKDPLGPSTEEHLRYRLNFSPYIILNALLIFLETGMIFEYIHQNKDLFTTSL